MNRGYGNMDYEVLCCMFRAMAIRRFLCSFYCCHVLLLANQEALVLFLFRHVLY